MLSHEYRTEKTGPGKAYPRGTRGAGAFPSQLALAIGSSKSHIWRIETGRVGVGIDDLGRIADALGSPVRDLLTLATLREELDLSSSSSRPLETLRRQRLRHRDQ
ncbi:MAG: helix-turn-helix domain-containing protein [Coriobacteriaceae bacterium]